MPSIPTIIIYLLIILLIATIITGITLAILESRKKSQRIIIQSPPRPVILSANSKPCNRRKDCNGGLGVEYCNKGQCQNVNTLPTLKTNMIITLQDQLYSTYMKPVFGCISTSGTSICLNDNTILDYPELYQWKINSIYPEQNIVSFQNVHLGTYLTDPSDSRIVKADSVTDTLMNTHWKILYVNPQKIMIQSVTTRFFLTIGSSDGLPILVLKDYDLNEDIYFWKYNLVSNNTISTINSEKSSKYISCTRNGECPKGTICLVGRCKAL